MIKNMNNDFYIKHLTIENDLCLCAQNIGIIYINRDDHFILTQDYVSNIYTVMYKNNRMFYFQLETNKSLDSFIIKDSKKIKIDENNISDFISKCNDFVIKIYSDYFTIKNNFYIDSSLIYMDKIPLKTLNYECCENTRIIINMDNSYKLIVNLIDEYYYTNLDELINSENIKKIRRTFLNNILSLVNFI